MNMNSPTEVKKPPSKVINREKDTLLEGDKVKPNKDANQKRSEKPEPKKEDNNEIASINVEIDKKETQTVGNPDENKDKKPEEIKTIDFYQKDNYTNFLDEINKIKKNPTILDPIPYYKKITTLISFLEALIKRLYNSTNKEPLTFERENIETMIKSMKKLMNRYRFYIKGDDEDESTLKYIVQEFEVLFIKHNEDINNLRKYEDIDKFFEEFLKILPETKQSSYSEDSVLKSVNGKDSNNEKRKNIFKTIYFESYSKVIKEITENYKDFDFETPRDQGKNLGDFAFIRKKNTDKNKKTYSFIYLTDLNSVVKYNFLYDSKNNKNEVTEKEIPSTNNQNPPNDNQDQPSKNQIPPVNNQEQPPNNQIPAMNNQNQPTVNQIPLMNNQGQPTNNQVPPMNNQIPPMNNQEQPTNNQIPPMNNQKQSTNNQNPPMNNQDQRTNNQSKPTTNAIINKPSNSQIPASKNTEKNITAAVGKISKQSTIRREKNRKKNILDDEIIEPDHSSFHYIEISKVNEQDKKNSNISEIDSVGIAKIVTHMAVSDSGLVIALATLSDERLLRVYFTTENKDGILQDQITNFAYGRNTNWLLIFEKVCDVPIKKNGEKATNVNIQGKANEVDKEKKRNEDKEGNEKEKKVDKEPTGKKPKDNVDEEPKDKVDEEPKDKVDEEPKDKLLDEPKNKVDEEPKDKVDEEPKDKLLDEPKNKVHEEPKVAEKEQKEKLEKELKEQNPKVKKLKENKGEKKRLQIDLAYIFEAGEDFIINIYRFKKNNLQTNQKGDDFNFLRSIDVNLGIPKPYPNNSLVQNIFAMSYLHNENQLLVGADQGKILTISPNLEPNIQDNTGNMTSVSYNTVARVIIKNFKNISFLSAYSKEGKIFTIASDGEMLIHFKEKDSKPIFSIRFEESERICYLKIIQDILVTAVRTVKKKANTGENIELSVWVYKIPNLEEKEIKKKDNKKLTLDQIYEFEDMKLDVLVDNIPDPKIKNKPNEQSGDPSKAINIIIYSNSKDIRMYQILLPKGNVDINSNFKQLKLGNDNENIPIQRKYINSWTQNNNRAITLYDDNTFQYHSISTKKHKYEGTADTYIINHNLNNMKILSQVIWYVKNINESNRKGLTTNILQFWIHSNDCNSDSKPNDIINDVLKILRMCYSYTTKISKEKKQELYYIKVIEELKNKIDNLKKGQEKIVFCCGGMNNNVGLKDFYILITDVCKDLADSISKIKNYENTYENIYANVFEKMEKQLKGKKFNENFSNFAQFLALLDHLEKNDNNSGKPTETYLKTLKTIKTTIIDLIDENQIKLFAKDIFKDCLYNEYKFFPCSDYTLVLTSYLMLYFIDKEKFVPLQSINILKHLKKFKNIGNIEIGLIEKKNYFFIINSANGDTTITLFQYSINETVKRTIPKNQDQPDTSLETQKRPANESLKTIENTQNNKKDSTKEKIKRGNHIFKPNVTFISESFYSGEVNVFLYQENMLAMALNSETLVILQFDFQEQTLNKMVELILYPHSDEINCIAISHDRNMIATGSDDESMKIFDCYSGKELKTIRYKSGAVIGLSFFPNNKFIAASYRMVHLNDTYEFKLYVFELESDKCIFNIGFKSWIYLNSIPFKYLLCPKDNIIWINDTSMKYSVIEDFEQSFKPVLDTTQSINSIYKLDNKLPVCICGGDSGAIQLTNSNNIFENNGKIYCLSISNHNSNENKIVAVGYSDGKLLILNLNQEFKFSQIDSAEIFDSNSEEIPIFSLDFSNNNKYLVCGLSNSYIKIFELSAVDKKLSVVAYCKIHKKSIIYDLKFRPSSQEYEFITGGYDKRVIITCLEHSNNNLSDISRIYVSKLHKGSVYTIAWSEDGKMFLSAGEDKRIIIYDRENFTVIRKIRNHSGSIWNAEFFSNNEVISSGEDKSVIVSDIYTSLEVYRKKLEIGSDLWDFVFIKDIDKLVVTNNQGVFESQPFLNTNSKLIHIKNVLQEKQVPVKLPDDLNVMPYPLKINRLQYSIAINDTNYIDNLTKYFETKTNKEDIEFNYIYSLLYNTDWNNQDAWDYSAKYASSNRNRIQRNLIELHLMMEKKCYRYLHLVKNSVKVLSIAKTFFPEKLLEIFETFFTEPFYITIKRKTMEDDLCIMTPPYPNINFINEKLNPKLKALKEKMNEQYVKGNQQKFQKVSPNLNRTIGATPQVDNEAHIFQIINEEQPPKDGNIKSHNHDPSKLADKPADIPPAVTVAKPKEDKKASIYLIINTEEQPLNDKEIITEPLINDPAHMEIPANKPADKAPTDLNQKDLKKTKTDKEEVKIDKNNDPDKNPDFVDDKIKTMYIKDRNLLSTDKNQIQETIEVKMITFQIAFGDIEKLVRILDGLNVEEKIFGSPNLSRIVKFYWNEKYKSWFLMSLLFYAIYLILVCLLVLRSFVDRITNCDTSCGKEGWEDGKECNSKCTDSLLKEALAYKILILIYIFLFIVREVCQLIFQVADSFRDKLMRHFFNMWNIIDLLMITTGLISLITDLLQGPGIGENDSVANDFLKIFYSLFFFLTWMRFLDYARGIEQISFLIRLLVKVILDMAGFLAVLFYMIVGFALMSFIVQNTYTEHTYDEFLSIFYLVLLGNYDTYLDINPKTHLNEGYSFAIIVAVSIIMVILMLNLLIALISESHERVMGIEHQANVYEKLDLIRGMEFSVYMSLKFNQILRRKESANTEKANPKQEKIKTKDDYNFLTLLVAKEKEATQDETTKNQLEIILSKLNAQEKSIENIKNLENNLIKITHNNNKSHFQELNNKVIFTKTKNKGAPETGGEIKK